MPEDIDLEVDVVVFCNTCGTRLGTVSLFIHHNMKDDPTIRIEACHKCVSEAYKDGDCNGFEKGRNAPE